jgi:hypothetical protein
MKNKDFHRLCNETPIGTTLSFNTGEHQVHGKFVGCSADGVLIEANEQVFMWPRDLIDYRKTDYPFPTYS